MNRFGTRRMKLKAEVLYGTFEATLQNSSWAKTWILGKSENDEKNGPYESVGWIIKLHIKNKIKDHDMIYKRFNIIIILI